MTDPNVLSEMPESATQPQSDTTADLQPIISEPPRAQEESPPAARWYENRSALLLIGGPLAGALLVWLAISIFGSSPDAPPEEAVAEQSAPEAQPAPEPAVEAQPAMEPQPAMDSSVADSAEADEPAAMDPEPPSSPEPRQEPEPAPSAVNASASGGEVSAINEVLPNAPQSALNTITGTVRVSVRVTIDSAGAVADATPEDGGPSRYFERISLAAAKKWTFAPDDLEQQRTMLVKFAFRRDGVTARAEPVE